MLNRIAEGRTDLVLDYVAQGHAANTRTSDGGSLLHWCAYYGDVSAMRFLLDHGENLQALGEDLGLNAAAFHGHWRLCQFLLEKDAKVDFRERRRGRPRCMRLSLRIERVSTRWSRCWFVVARIRTWRRMREWKRERLCAIAAPAERLRCIAQQPLRAKRRSSC